MILENIYYRKDEEVEEYLKIVFQTDKGFFQMSYGKLSYVGNAVLDDFKKMEILEELKSKYGVLTIEDVRTTYDGEMYFLIANQFIIASRFTQPSERMISFQELTIEEGLHGSNKAVLEEFLSLDKVEIPE